jgi:outer membrane receptor protein involved in Fe transport
LKTQIRFFAGVAILVMLVYGSTQAQVESGQIAGTITDPSGAVIANATITVTNQATNAVRTTHTSASGAYQVSDLEPATYLVAISSANFQTYQARVEVTVGGHSTVDVKLVVGSGTTQVEVVAAGSTQVNTQSQELSQVVDTQQLEQLPSLTRNPYDFVALSGNVSNGDSTMNSMNSGQTLTDRGVGYAINGQRESGTEILLDGVENVGVFGATVGEDIPTDAVQEYSVITNNFSAEYGRASGGVVNLTTKTGTNKFHGTGWEFNRLSAYTANTYANDAANWAAGSVVDPKGIYARNQFGFVVDGPILRNKLFFEESTEWTRVRSSASVPEEILDPGFIATLPSNVQGYFGAFGTGAPTTYTATTTYGQLAPAIAAQGGALGTAINGVTPIPASQPIFDTVTVKAPFDAGGGVPENVYTLSGRVDFNVTDKTQMFFRVARENVDQFLGSAFYSAYPQYDVGSTDINQSYLYSLVHTFNPNLLGSAKLSFTRFNDFNSFDVAQVNAPMLMIVPPSDPLTGGLIQLPGLENEGAPGLGGLPFGGPQNTIQIEPDLSWTKGNHSMKFGGQFTYIQLNVAYGAYAQAVEELGGTVGDSFNDLINADANPGGSQLIAFDARVDPQGKLPCVANPGYWLTGAISDLNQDAACAVTPPLSSAVYGRSYRYQDWAIYAQDSWRITPRLTLNYGVRYEHYGVQHNNKANLDSNFYFGSGSSVEQQVRNGQIFIADQSPVGGFWAPSWGTVGPRIGFAFDVFGDGKMSVRGGYGISYERNFGNVTYNASFNPPASAVLSSVCGPSVTSCTSYVTNNDLGPLGVAGPPSYLGPSELRMPDPNIHVAQTQFWSMAVQREIAHNTIVEADYSGAHGVHLYDIENINLLGSGQFYLGDPLTFTASPDCPSPCLNRSNNQYSNINMRGSLGTSEYQALNLKFQTQNLHNTGFSMVANYTYSHSLDDLSSTFSDSLQGGSEYIGSLGYTDAFNPGLDWGSSDFDERNRLAVTPIWATPWFKTGHGWKNEVAGGWNLSGIFTIRTGIPFSVFDYTNIFNFYTIPRLTPATPITNYKVQSPQAAGANLFNALSVPVPASFAPLDPTLGISDFGPYPADMSRRNAFRGPGAFNVDLAADKRFRLTERVGLEFRAEGFDIFNHHNYYVNSTNLLYDGATTSPLEVTELKGGLGSLATGGNHDERRFGQFALKLQF